MTGGGSRSPVAAGTFYPAEATPLAGMVDALLAAAVAGPSVPAARGVVAPHAGYRYSGPVAAAAYVRLRSGRPDPGPVAILGPSHFVPLFGAAVSAADAWRTPLGEVEIDTELRRVAVDAGARPEDTPHGPEHSIEVQLPFLQRLWPRGAAPTVLPVAIGVWPPAATADLIEALSSLATIVISTDMSHYHDQATARRLDRRTARAVQALNPDAIGPEDACGVYALRGVVEWARRAHGRIELIDLRTSADTAGDPTRVVGYGAFAVLAPPITEDRGSRGRPTTSTRARANNS